MSIGNQILDSKYLGHFLDRTPDGRTRISRRWEITADKTNPAELEEILFQQYGAADGADSSQYAFTPNSEKIFEGAYLVEQYVRSQGRGVSPNLYTLTKVYEEADDTLRLLTSPSFRTDENGRRYATSRYVVLTSAWEAEDSELAGEVGATKLGPESPFVLSEEKTESDGFVLTIVTREWVEATAEATEIGKLGHFRGPDGILRYSQRFIQLASSPEVLGEIGVEQLPGTGAKLFTQRSESSGVVRSITKEYVMPGIVSQSTDFRNNGKLEIRTVQSFVDPVETPDGFTLTSTSTENPEGYPITTYRFAKGEGRVSTDVSTRNNGKLTITRIRFLGSDDASKPSGVLISSDTEQRDGHTVTTESYADGEGRISTDADDRNAKLTITTIRFLGDDDETKPDGVKISTDTRQEDGYTQTTERYASGSGRIEWRIARRENQLLVDHTIRYIGEDDGDPISGTLIDESESEEAGYKLYSKTYRTASSGEISRTVRTRNNGKLTITTVRALGSKVTAPGVEIESSEESRDGFTVYTSVGVSGEGRVSLREELRHNGKLTITTVQYVGEDDGDDSGEIDGVLISSGSEEQDGYILFTDRYASGSGLISTDTDRKLGGSLVITTQAWLTADDDSAGPSALTGEFQRSYREENGYRLWTVRGAEGSGIIEDNTQTRYGGKLDVRTVLSLNTEVHAEGEVSFTADVRDGYTLFTSIGVSGSGRFYSTTTSREGGLVSVFTIRYVNEDDGTPPDGVLISTESEQHEGFTIFTESYVLASSSGTISTQTQTRYGGKLTLTTIRTINTEPTAPAGSVLVSTQTQAGEGYTIYTATFAAGKGRISENPSNRYNGKLKQTVIRYLDSDVDEDGNPNAKPDGVLIASSVTAQDGYDLFEETYVSGSGRISEETSSRLSGTEEGSGLTSTTIRFLDADVDANGDPNEKPEGFKVSSSSREAEGYTLYEETYIAGSGTFAEESSTSLNGKLTTVTKRAINAAPDAPEGDNLALVRDEISEADGYTIHTRSWVYGSGLIDEKTENRQDGSVIYSVVSLNEVLSGDPPEGSYLISTDSEPGNGYLVYTRTYYKPPADYTVPVVFTVRRPGVINADSTGIVIGRIPANVSVAATATVTFTTTPSLPAITPINPGSVIFEQADFDDGKFPEHLYNEVSMGEFYAGTGFVAPSGGTYRGRSTSFHKVDIVGAADQAGQTLTFSAKAEPFFRSESLTVYKQTVVTGVLPEP